jgi:hypothetical protein
MPLIYDCKTGFASPIIRTTAETPSLALDGGKIGTSGFPFLYIDGEEENRNGRIFRMPDF